MAVPNCLAFEYLKTEASLGEAGMMQSKPSLACLKKGSPAVLTPWMAGVVLQGCSYSKGCQWVLVQRPYSTCWVQCECVSLCEHVCHSNTSPEHAQVHTTAKGAMLGLAALRLFVLPAAQSATSPCPCCPPSTDMHTVPRRLCHAAACSERLPVPVWSAGHGTAAAPLLRAGQHHRVRPQLFSSLHRPWRRHPAQFSVPSLPWNASGCSGAGPHRHSGSHRGHGPAW